MTAFLFLFSHVCKFGQLSPAPSSLRQHALAMAHCMYINHYRQSNLNNMSLSQQDVGLYIHHTLNMQRNLLENDLLPTCMHTTTSQALN